jgi:hypothetical protein
VLEFVCYLLALVFALIATLAPQLSPALDRLRLLSAAFACFVLPLLVHAAEQV